MRYHIMNADFDNSLISDFKNGDTEALGALIEKYKAPLYSYIFSFVKSESAAEDIFQDIFLKFIKRPDCYKENTNFKNWLFTVARNSCMDYFRASRKDFASLDMEIEDGLTLKDTLADDDKEPLEELIEKTDSLVLYKTLDTLSLEQKEVIVLRQTMSFAEIAQLLNCPIGTVLARASRAYKKMAEILKKQEF